MISTEKHNAEVMKIWAESLNKKDCKALMIFGTKHNEYPTAYWCGDLPKETLIEFMRMTADMLESGELPMNRVGEVK